MPVKPDHWIIEMARKGMIEPFEAEQVKTGISFGTSSYGYDFRISDEFKIFKPTPGDVIDPKNFDSLSFENFKGAICTIPSGSHVLAKTVEYFRIPRNILTIAYGKSTYARCGISINVTPFEPEWEGFATIAIVNQSALPAKVYAFEGIGQLIFLEADQECATSYADKKGKYQAQQIITGAKI